MIDEVTLQRINQYVKFDYGDSSNPDEKFDQSIQHLNYIRSYVKLYNGEWLNTHIRNSDEFYSYFIDCKTNEDYELMFQMMFDENIIYDEKAQV